MNEKLRRYLRDNQITQTKFAEDLKTRPQMVTYWLSGKHTPRAKTMKRIEEMTEGAVPMSSWFEPAPGLAE